MQAIDARFLKRLRDALADNEVKYLFIGKGAAIIQGFSDTTQDADIFVKKTADNAERLIRALNEVGAELTDQEADSIRQGKDFVQLGYKINIDVIHAPDAIDDFEQAWSRGRNVDGYNVCSLDDIIASKMRANRQKDRETLGRLLLFRKYLKEERRETGTPLPRPKTRKERRT